MGFFRRMRRVSERIDMKAFDKESREVRWADLSEVEGLVPYLIATYTDDDGMGDVEHYVLPTGEYIRVKRPSETFPL